MAKATTHRDCTVLRIQVIRQVVVNLATGDTRNGTVETVTQPCGVPLFSAHAKATGVCRSCASGWEVPESLFATPDEKKRALAAAAPAPRSEADVMLDVLFGTMPISRSAE